MSFSPPLTGVRIVDLTQVGAGPYCSSLLGDMGAEVVKIEPPGGEPMRTVDNFFGPKESAYYFGINRSKRSITLDMKSERGREVFDRLIAQADVFMIGMRPGAVDRLGLSYEALERLNPRLIYCSLTAFGETGPRADEPGMDIVAQALSGIMGLTGDPDRPPVKAGASISDWTLSFLSCFAICAALIARERDGVGQKLSLNLLDGSIACLPNFVTPFFAMGIPIRRSGGGHPQVVPYQVFATADGHMVVACLSDQFWAPLCRALDREDLVDDPRYYTNGERVKHRDDLVPIVAKALETRPTAEWVELFKRHDVPHAPVHQLEDVFEDPQVVHNGALLELQHPRFGPYKAVNNPVKMSKTPPQPFGYSPGPGEHTEEVLRELGYSDAEIDELRATAL